MSTITKERIELFIKNPLENGLTRGEQMELARIALASLEAEAVAYMHHSGQVVTREECCDDKIFAICCKVETPLYAAPQLPQPVVAITQHFDTIALDTAKMVMCDVNRRDEFFGGDIQLLSRIQYRIDEACRAAMLQSDGPLTNEGTMQLSGNSEQIEPVSNSDELPLDYLQGHKDGLEWAAQLAEANNPQTGDWLYDDPIDLARAIRKGPDIPEFKSVSVDEDDNFYSWFGRLWYENYQKNNYTTSAKQMLGTMAEFAYRAGRESAALAGNSPVIPDGWISCSELMPDDGQHVIILCDGAFVLYAQYRDGEFFDIVRNGDEFFETQSRNVTHWMPLPEPPQGVNRG